MFNPNESLSNNFHPHIIMFPSSHVLLSSDPLVDSFNCFDLTQIFPPSSTLGTKPLSISSSTLRTNTLYLSSKPRTSPRQPELFVFLDRIRTRSWFMPDSRSMSRKGRHFESCECFRFLTPRTYVYIKFCSPCAYRF